KQAKRARFADSPITASFAFRGDEVRPRGIQSPTGQSNGLSELVLKTEKPAAMRRAFAFFVQ
ncbi:hypothetical protein, partial [Phaeobacter sp. 22II1-1F12B]|uniref:hypothetical protein n=1 Tax=Phaeobacter sp. 22II1-1F12B TaxID=1317111 RepID=UPI001E394792